MCHPTHSVRGVLTLETKPAGRPCSGCHCYGLLLRHERPWLDRIDNVGWGGAALDAACEGCYCSGRLRHHRPNLLNHAGDMLDDALDWVARHSLAIALILPIIVVIVFLLSAFR